MHSSQRFGGALIRRHRQTRPATLSEIHCATGSQCSVSPMYVVAEAYWYEPNKAGSTTKNPVDRGKQSSGQAHQDQAALVQPTGIKGMDEGGYNYTLRMYGSAYGMKEKQKQRLSVFEMACLRKIEGVTRRDRI